MPDGVQKIALPRAEYAAMRPVWDRIRAVLGGETEAKDFDGELRHDGTNLLVPFSPKMKDDPWRFYLSEAELPGIVRQFARTIIGGMLRKPVAFSFPSDSGLTDVQRVQAERWLKESIGTDGSSLLAFLDEVLWHELNNSRTWIQVNHPGPNALMPDGGPPAPYPRLVPGENVVNWRVSEDPATRRRRLTQVVVLESIEREPKDDTDFHPGREDRAYVHELDATGLYRVRTFALRREDGAPYDTGPETGPLDRSQAVGGELVTGPVASGGKWTLIDTDEQITLGGARLDFIPLWPLNGSVDLQRPFMEAFVDREIGLYNKISRRNHLLYGAATYTPWIKSDELAQDENKQRSIVNAGLGSWIFLDPEDGNADLGIMQTPTEALQSYEAAIKQTIDELTRMGIRMLAEENAESGVAVELHNAGPVAQLAALSRLVSQTLSKVLSFMVQWRYRLAETPEISAFLSTDFSAVPVGEDYMRLATEMYMDGAVPRSLWLSVLKANDMLPADYDDEDAPKEIADDPVLKMIRDQLEKMQSRRAAPGGARPTGQGDKPSGSNRPR